MQKLGQALAKLNRAFAILTGATILLMMFHVVADVAGKYLFSIPIPGTLEVVAEYYMVIIVFMPLALTEQRGAHISVEVLTRHLPARVQSALAVLTGALSACFVGALTYRMWLDALERTEAGTTVLGATDTIVTWPSYYFMPVGAAAMTIVLVYRLLVRLTGAADGLPEPPQTEMIGE